jgi:hypothetical protein
VCKQFEKVGILNKVIFYRPDPEPIGNMLRSTLWCLNDALVHEPLKNILIFEDDVCFSIGRFLHIPFNEWFIYLQNEWDTIRLGYWKGIFMEKLDGSYYRGNCLGTHAIIYSPYFACKLLDDNRSFEEKGIIDRYISSISGRHYLLRTSVCYQTGGLLTNVLWPNSKIQGEFLKNPIHFQLKYQQRTHMAWNYCGKYLPKIFGFRGYAQMLIVIDWSELWNSFKNKLGQYVFLNKSLL